MYSDKLQLVLPFIYDLSCVVKKWEDSNNSEKYPDEDYLNQLCNNAKIEFEDMMLAFNEFKNDYLLKLESLGD